MFDNKLDFKQTFERRLSEKYGRTVADSHITEQYEVLGEMVRDYAGSQWRVSRESLVHENYKQLVYFSMEFLIGKLLISNLHNLGIYKMTRDGLKEMGIDLKDLAEQESDAGLGNGGLGRLAACFLDSAATLALPLDGYGIRSLNRMASMASAPSTPPASARCHMTSRSQAIATGCATPFVYGRPNQASRTSQPINPSMIISRL